MMAMDRVLEQYQDDDGLALAIMLPAAQADMAGQLMVHEHESKRQLTFALTPEPAFLDLPWDEALAAFKARGLINDDELSTLLDTYRARSGEARRLMLQQLQAASRRSLEKAIEEGSTLAEYAADMAETGDALGIGVTNHAYLENVFRTNIQSAYGAGRFRAVTHPDVMAARPYVQYRTSGDTRVRPSHALLDGAVFRTDSERWRRIAPPNGYQCRCSVVTLDDDDLRAEGLRVIDDIPPGGEPDEGFDAPPLELVEKELE